MEILTKFRIKCDKRSLEKVDNVPSDSKHLLIGIGSHFTCRVGSKVRHVQECWDNKSTHLPFIRR